MSYDSPVTYRSDSSGSILGVTAPGGKRLGFGPSALTQVRQRDKFAIQNNGALIQAPIWATGTSYVPGQVVRYSNTNPALIVCCSAKGTSGASIATFTSVTPMSDGTQIWGFTGRYSKPAQGVNLYNGTTSITSLEVPTIAVATSAPGGGTNIFTFSAAQTTVAATFNPSVSWPVNPYIVNVGTSVTGVICNRGDNSVLNGAPANGWNPNDNTVIEFISDAAVLTMMPLQADSGSGFVTPFIGYVGEIDGSNMYLIEESPTQVAFNAGSPSYYTMTWPTGRRLRRYRFETYCTNPNTPAMGGIYIDSQSVIYPVPNDGVTGLFIDDSFANTDDTGNSAGTQLGGQIHYMMGVRSLKLAGIRWAQIIAGVGGGYVAGSTTWNGNGGTSVPIPKILGYQPPTGFDNTPYLQAFQPNVVVINGGYNDTTSANSTLVQANAFITFNRIRLLWPNAYVIVVGPQPGSKAASGTTTIAQIDAAVKTAFNSWADPNSAFYSVVNDVAGNWVTGTGFVLHTTGTGNSDYYTGFNNIHPPMWGHEYLSRRMAYVIDSILTSVGL